MRVRLQREDDQEYCPAARRHDIKLSADDLSPFLHDAKSDMRLVRLIFVMVKSKAIIMYFELPGRLLLNLQGDVRSIGVFSYVGQRLLNDMKHLNLRIREKWNPLPFDR